MIGWETQLLRLGIAIVLGLALGWEREAKGKPAGLKTHSLVALGACTFTLIGLLLSEATGAPEQSLRVLEGLIGGIGFLGAGAIIQARGDVQGLTTATDLWVAAGIGASVGTGYYPLAVAVTAGALIVLRVLGPLSHAAVDGDDAPDGDED